MKKTTIKDHMKEFLSEKEFELVPRSFEIVGDIAIIEIPEELIKFENKIAQSIFKVNKAIKVVLKKSGIHKGEFRTQDLIHLAGENRKDTIYLENGIRLCINPETVYFSARLSTERENLMKDLKENKRILVMFSGCGPYSFVALKKQPNLARITSIEINPNGHKYALESSKLNKNIIKKSNIFKNLISFLKENKLPIYEKKIIELLNELKIKFINGDVNKETKKLILKNYNKEIKNNHNELFTQNEKDLFSFLMESNFKEITLDLDKIKITEKLKNLIILFSDKFNFICTIDKTNYIFDNSILKGYLLNYLEGFSIKTIEKFDEIFMPLPKDAELFLESAFYVADKNAIIHMYDFLHENEFPQKSENAIKEAGKKFGRKIEIIQTRKVGQYSPRKYRVCCDFIVK